MPTDKYGDLPPRPPLSVPFPLQLGDEFHLGTAETVEQASKRNANSAPVPGREPKKHDGHERGG